MATLPMMPQRKIGLPHVLMGGGAGAGATLMYLLLNKEPKAVIEAFKSFGPQACIALLALVLIYQAFGQLLQVAREHAASQQKLADAVTALSERDDRAAEEQRRLLNYMGSQQEKLLDASEETRRAVGELHELVVSRTGKQG